MCISALGAGELKSSYLEDMKRVDPLASDEPFSTQHARETSMNATPAEQMSLTKATTDGAHDLENHDAQDELVEVGKVSRTQSGFFGNYADPGGGYQAHP